MGTGPLWFFRFEGSHRSKLTEWPTVSTLQSCEKVFNTSTDGGSHNIASAAILSGFLQVAWLAPVAKATFPVRSNRALTGKVPPSSDSARDDRGG